METKTNYDYIKLKIEENKKRVVFGVCAVLLFIVGFGTGRAEREFRKTPTVQTNYTTKTPENKGGDDPVNITAEPPITPSTTGSTLLSCNIKGTSSRIYHLPGGAFYERITAPVACFETEAEAQAAGYRKSSR